MPDTLAFNFDDAVTTILPGNALALLNETPDFSVSAELVIAPLAPLSLVSRMPRKYYRSDDAPTPQMLYGLLENALGWHVSREHRKKVMDDLKRRFQLVAAESQSGFQPLLQHHVRFEAIQLAPVSLRFSDYWGRLARTKGLESASGSREYSAELIPIMDEIENSKSRPRGEPTTTVTDSGGVNNLSEANSGDKVNVSALQPYLPHYYLAPATREYIETKTAFVITVQTSLPFAALLSNAVEYPMSPLYLGNNDGWRHYGYNNRKTCGVATPSFPALWTCRCGKPRAIVDR